MELKIGQKVAYPNQGVCLVEKIEKKQIGEISMKFYALRVLSDKSMILVPIANAETVGIRPIIGDKQYRSLVRMLKKNFEIVSDDWKVRSREFNDKLQSGDIFEAADVLKKLTYLSNEKKLSFREQTLLEKAKFLIVSELCCADMGSESTLETKIDKLVESACNTYNLDGGIVPKVVAVAAAH